MKILIPALLLSVCSCTKSQRIINNGPSIGWAPENQSTGWSQTTIRNDGTRTTNIIVIGFRDDGVVVWKLGKEIK